MPKKKKGLTIIFIVAIGILLAIYFYSQLISTEIPIHSDDAATATDMRDVIEMGTAGWKYWTRPLTILNGILYMLIGPGELFLQVFFAVKYFICISLTLYLALYMKDKFMWWLLPFFIFFCLPGNFGTASIHPLKFHVWTQVVPLFCLAYIITRGNDFRKLKKWDILVIIGVCVFGLIERDILVVVTCWLPYLLYALIYAWQNGIVKKYRQYLLIFGMLALLLGKAFLSTIEYKGYGASRFVSIEDIGNNLVMGITGFLSMFNIDLIGSNVLKFQTIIYGIRLLIVGYAIWCLVTVIKEIVAKKIENVDMVNAVLAISIVVLVAVYMFGGMREDAISIRYMAYTYYAFLVISCRKCGELIDRKKFEFRIKQCRIHLIPCFFVTCIIVTLDPIVFTREENEADQLAEQMMELDNIECGMGSFWAAGVTSCLTDYKMEIQAGESNNGRIVPYLSKWDSYCSGNRYYNYFLEDCARGDFGITAKNLLEGYGIYDKKYELENANVYVYDYDIRTAPLIINTGHSEYFQNYDALNIENNCIKLKRKESFVLDNLYFSVGKVRMSVYGKFGGNAFAIESDEDVDIQMVNKKKNAVVYEITAKKLYESLSIKLTNKGNDRCEITNICMERLENSILLPNDATYTMDLEPGYYIFGMEGEQIKNSEMLFETNGTRCYAERINNGRKKVAFGIQVAKYGEVKIKIKNKGSISEIYYQNEIRSTFENPRKRIFTLKNGIQVKKSTGLLYGPYVDLEPGIYEVDIYGEGLDNADIRFSYDGGIPLNDAMLIQNNKDHLVYRIELNENRELFEVLISDGNNHSVKVSYYTLTYADSDFLKKVDLLYNYNDHSIQTSGGHTNQDEILLNKDEVCYGPYINLPSGRYRLEIFGSHLSDAEIAVTFQNGEQTVTGLWKKNSTFSNSELEFVLEQAAENVEVVIRNHQDDAVHIKYYKIQSLE